jgi:RsiW-degrading membrane proteinase PrsW (M82 family)
MHVLLLVGIAVLPPVFFLIYILHLDKLEPEPLRLIFKMLILGGIAVIPAGLAEIFLGVVPILNEGGAAGGIAKSFLMIAPIEEGVKLAVVLLFVWKNPNFNEENDGIVYVGTTAVGFAMFENILYVIRFGLATGLLRSMTSIPLHTFTGVFMGYFVGIARCAHSTHDMKKYIFEGFFIAYVMHAVYDSFVLSGTAAAVMIIPLVIALFIFGFIYLKKGQRLSAKRWSSAGSGACVTIGIEAGHVHTAGSHLNAGSELYKESRSRGLYKIVISRILFAVSAFFWFLLIAGMATRQGGNAASLPDIIAGGIIISVIPIVTGIVLEISFRRGKTTIVHRP